MSNFGGGLVSLPRLGSWMTEVFDAGLLPHNSAAHHPALLGSFVCLAALLGGCRGRRSPGQRKRHENSWHCTSEAQPVPISLLLSTPGCAEGKVLRLFTHLG